MYKVIAENERRTVEHFETRYFETFRELNEYFEGFETCDVGVFLNIYRDDAKLIGYMQQTPEGLVAVRRNAAGEEVLLED